MTENSWGEWSKHVLRELERLNEGQDAIKQELHEIRGGMTKLAILEEQVKDVRNWQQGRQEIVSTTQLAEIKKEVEDLKVFKTRSVTIFGIVQAIILALLGFLGIK